jgi:hypothetical protein
MVKIADSRTVPLVQVLMQTLNPLGVVKRTGNLKRRKYISKMKLPQKQHQEGMKAYF